MSGKKTKDILRELAELVYDIGKRGRPFPFEDMLEALLEFDPNAEERKREIAVRMEAYLRAEYERGRLAGR